MLTADRNALITQSGPGTPLGAFMRQYWQPAALVDEFDDIRPVRRVRLLGEDLVLFRDPAGRYGLLDRHCAHRGADLAIWPYGGWRAALSVPRLAVRYATGACLEQPAEPDGSKFLRNPSARPPTGARVASGIVFDVHGAPANRPALPAFDCFAAPEHATPSPSRA